MKRFAWLLLVTDGGDDTGADDAALDGSATDGTILDGTLSDGASDGGASDGATNEASTDAAKETSCVLDGATPDAFADLDAATSGWGQTYGQGEFRSAAVDSKGHVLLGGSAGNNADMDFFLQEVDSAGSSIWTKKVGSTASYVNHRAWAVAYDTNGAMYAAGETDDAIDLGGGSLGPGGFVVKYDASGNFVWEYGPFANTQFYAMRVRPNGNVVAVGSLQGTANYGGGSLSSVSGSVDALLVEVTSCKSFVRSQIWGDGSDQEVRGIAIDASGDLFLGGRFAGSLDFGGGAMTGPTNGFNVYDMFVAKLDANASYLHQLETGSASDNSLDSVDVNASGNVFVTGHVAEGDSVNLGGGKLTASGAYDMFVGELDSSLGYVWAKHVGASGSGDLAQGHVAIADPFAGVVVVGQYGGADINFGQGAFSNGQGPFIARYDSTGTCVASWGSSPNPGQAAYAYAGAYLSWPDFIIGGGATASFTAPSGSVGAGAFALRIKP